MEVGSIRTNQKLLDLQPASIYCIVDTRWWMECFRHGVGDILPEGSCCHWCSGWEVQYFEWLRVTSARVFCIIRILGIFHCIFRFLLSHMLVTLKPYCYFRGTNHFFIDLHIARWVQDCTMSTKTLCPTLAFLNLLFKLFRSSYVSTL